MKIRDRIKELRRVPAGQLLPNGRNWRKHPKAQQEALQGVLAEIGYAGALIAYETPQGLKLIDGHLRASTTPESLVPVLILDVNDDEANKLLATLDPLAAMAEADSNALEALLRDVQTGSQALADMLTNLAEEAGILNDEQKELNEDEVPEPPADPVTKPGDLWLLGDHRVMCGDSTKADDVGRLMAGKKADAILTDPPYGVAYVGKTKDALTVDSDDCSEEQLEEYVKSWFDLCEANSRDGAYWYATVPPGPLHTVFCLDWKRRGILRQIMVWVKDSLVLGHSEYHYRHEPILFGWIPGKRHKNSDRTRTTVFEFARPKASREHPTMKPLELWVTLMQDATRKGELLYEPFCGSGTTLIAAEQLGRKCYGMEISPQYCDVIVKRWENLTGKKADNQKQA